MSKKGKKQAKGGSYVYSPKRLREKLHRRIEQSKTDLAGHLFERSRDSFNLALPSEAATPVEVQLLAFSNDPFVGEPEVMRMAAVDIRPGLSNDRFRIGDTLAPAAQPNDDGNYLFELGSPEFDQVNSFFCATRTLRMYENYLTRPIPWGFSGILTINPHAGTDANAFYSESDRSLQFFSFTANRKEIRTCQSPDIVCHETGHAILDGYKDLYNESFGYASGGTHESFGDISAILFTLHNQSVVDKLLQITGGNLRQDNFVSSLAEQLGVGLHSIDTDPRNDNIFYMRNALNDFVDIPYDDLEFIPDNELTTLGAEAHSYSRLFTAAFFDVLVGIYESLRDQFGTRGALSSACDLAGKVFSRGLELGPVGEHYYSDLALAILDADAIYFQGDHQDILISKFSGRKILSRQQAQKHLDERKNLPRIILPPNISSPEAAVAFVNSKKDSLSVPQDIELLSQNAYKNQDGITFLNFFQTQRTILDGSEFRSFNGSPLDIFGGVCLMFDSENKLGNYTTRLVTDNDVKQVKSQIVKMIDAGIIQAEAPLSALPLLNVDTKIKGSQKSREIPMLHSVQGIAVKTDTGESKLVRPPFITDIINTNTPGVKDFAKKWKLKYDKAKK